MLSVVTLYKKISFSVSRISAAVVVTKMLAEAQIKTTKLNGFFFYSGDS